MSGRTRRARLVVLRLPQALLSFRWIHSEPKPCYLGVLVASPRSIGTKYTPSAVNIAHTPVTTGVYWAGTNGCAVCNAVNRVVIMPPRSAAHAFDVCSGLTGSTGGVGMGPL